MTRDEIKNKIQLKIINVNKKKLKLKEEGLKEKKEFEGMI